MFIENSARGLSLALFLVMGGTVCSGCKNNDEIVTPEGTGVQRRLKSVHWLFTSFRNHQGGPPASMDELNKYGEKLSQAAGGPVRLTEEYLMSARDKKPLRVRFNLPDLPAGANGPILAHEEEGWKGRRFVVYAVSGNVEELDDARFQTLLR